MRKIRVGTRGSKLALEQTEIAVNNIINKNPHISKDYIEIIAIKTTGDKILDKSLAEIGGKSLFTKEIENELIAGNIDLAVHSLKDFTSKLPTGLAIKAVLERDDPRDAIASFSTFKDIEEIPKASVIGTSSCRRKAQLLYLRPELTIAPLRGNVITRINKLEKGEVNIAVLAVAGLKRLNIDQKIYTPIPTNVMLPAPGQGVICIECREDDHFILEICASINHQPTMQQITAERAFLEVLEANCQTPIAAYATPISNNRIYLTAEIYSSNGDRHHLSGEADICDSFAIGNEFGLKLKDKLKK